MQITNEYLVNEHLSKEDLWHAFEKTGNIDFYIMYKDSIKNVGSRSRFDS